MKYGVSYVFSYTGHKAYYECVIGCLAVQDFIERRIKWKEKCHRIKHHKLYDPSGYIYFISFSQEGCIYNKAIYNKIPVKTVSQSLLMYLGFVGAEKD